MADVILASGSSASAGVPAPYLTSQILASGDGLATRTAAGMGRATRRFSDGITAVQEGAQLSGAQLQSLMSAVSAQASQASQQITYNFEGMVGPPGPPGETRITYLQAPIGLGQVGRYGVDGADGADGADGVDAFANIDIPIPYSGWEGAFTNNSPGAGSVAWTSFKVKYQGVEYTITASNTALTYLYWSVTSPSVLSASNTRADAVGVGKFFVGVNNAGTFEQSQFIKLITAGFLSVLSLSALTADLGTVTAGTIIMDLGSTYRLKISPSGIQGSINSGSSYFDIIALSGSDVIVKGTKIEASSVGSTQLAVGAASSFKKDSTAGSQSYTTGSSTVATLTGLVSTGGIVPIRGQADILCTNNPVDNVALEIWRDDGGGAALIFTESFAVSHSVRQTKAIYYEDEPGSGTFTYTFKLNGDVDGGTATNTRFRAYEMLR